MPGIKELKNKIKSVKSTRKITRAMQMVSASKMRKAQTSAINSRKYSDLAWELIQNLNAKMGEGLTIQNDSEESLSKDNMQGEGSLASLGMARLLQPNPNATKTGVIIISTNKGLVGSFNTNLINKLRELERADVIAELLVMGKKVKEAAVRTNRNLIADFPKKDTWVSVESIFPLAKAVTDLYLTGEYKQILVIYNHFVSTLVQKPTVKQLLPFVQEDVVAPFMGPNGKQSSEPDKSGNYNSLEFLFEPTPKIVLEHLIPRILESQLYQAVLESDASEHSARMIMMKNATEAAGDLIADYTLTYNQLRQNKITTELAEITAGKIALE